MTTTYKTAGEYGSMVPYTAKIVAHCAGLIAGRESESVSHVAGPISGDGSRGDCLAEAKTLAAGSGSGIEGGAAGLAHYHERALYLCRSAVSGIETDDEIVASLRSMSSL